MQQNTSVKDQKIASESLPRLKSLLEKHHDDRSGKITIKIQEENEIITIPKKAFLLLIKILTNMSEGKAVNIIPAGAEVSTQQAADMLNMSRPHLVKLLEEGKIPYKKVGSHRRMLLSDVVDFEKRLYKTREEQLKLLAEQAQQLNLGYE